MASIGTLITRVYTSRAEIPIQGATVAVTQKSTNGRHQLLATRLSNSSGKTTPIQINTPNLSAGLSPGNQTPFTLVDLWVEAPGYEIITIQDIQVFPGVETVQELELIPLPEMAIPGSRSEQVQITPQNL